MIVRMFVTALVAALVFGSSAFVSCGGGGGGGGGGPVAPPGSPTTKVVNMVGSPGGFAFSPRNLTIDRGDTVIWFNATAVIHTTTEGTGCTPQSPLWNSGNLASGDMFMAIFGSAGIDTTGMLPYFCIPHCAQGMTGTLTINP